MSLVIQLLIVILPLLTIPFLPHLRSLIHLIHSLKYLPAYMSSECENNNRKIRHLERMRKIFETRRRNQKDFEKICKKKEFFSRREKLDEEMFVGLYNESIPSDSSFYSDDHLIKKRNKSIDAITQCSHRDFEAIMQRTTSLYSHSHSTEMENKSTIVACNSDNIMEDRIIKISNISNNTNLPSSTSTTPTKEASNDNPSAKKYFVAGSILPLGGVMRWRPAYKNGLRSQGRMVWLEDPDELPTYPDSKEQGVQYEEDPENNPTNDMQIFTSRIVVLTESKGLQCEIIPSTADESWLTEARLRRRNQRVSMRLDSLAINIMDGSLSDSGSKALSPHLFKTGVATLESCPWTAEVESVELHSNVHSIVQRYFEQTLASLTKVEIAENEIVHVLENNITTICLANMRLRSIPASLAEIAFLTQIDLSCNLLTTLPYWFFASTEKTLQSLDISRNYFFSLPSQFRSFKKLKRLNISYNKLQFFPTELLELFNLTELNISHNSLIAIPSTISHLKLTDLDISSNSLFLLPETFTQLAKRLKFLRCQDNPFTYKTRSRILKKLVTAMSQTKRSQTSKNTTTLTHSTPKLDQNSNNIPTSSKISHSRTTSIQSDHQEFEDTELFDEHDGEKNSRVLLLLELLEYEEQYLRHLNIFSDLYIVPLQKHLEETMKRYDMQNNIITNDKISILLPDKLFQIIAFSRSFIIQLKEIMGSYESNPLNLREITNIGSLFMEQLDFFESYFVPYISVFDRSMQQQSDMKECAGFSKFLKGRITHPLSQGLDFEAFISLPLSRIHMYTNFMRKLKKATSTDHVDYAQIRNAIAAVNRCNILQIHDNFVIDNNYKLMDIQKSLKLKKTLATPGRILVREGVMGLASNRQLHQFTKEIGKYIAGVKSYENYKKIQLNPYIEAAKNKIKDKTAGDVVNDLWGIRIAEANVHLYLFSDILIMKELNVLHKLVSRVKKYELLGATVYPYTHKSHKEHAICVELKKGNKLVFVPENESQFLLWIRDFDSVINDLNLKYEEMADQIESNFDFDDILSIADAEDVSTDDDVFFDFYD